MKLVEMSSFYARPEEEDNLMSHLDLKDHTDGKEMTYYDKKARIAKDFGGKKAKETVNRHEQNKVNLEEITEIMTRTIDKVEVETPEDKVDENLNNFIAILPKCNRNANHPNEVYKIFDIIKEPVLQELMTESEQLLSQKEETKIIRSVIFEELLGAAKLEKNVKQQITLTAIALYVEYLVRFIKLNKFKSNKNENLIKNCPKKVEIDILSNFTERINKKQVCHREFKDKAICCVFILSFIVNRYELSHSCINNTFSLSDFK